MTKGKLTAALLAGVTGAALMVAPLSASAAVASSALDRAAQNQVAVDNDTKAVAGVVGVDGDSRIKTVTGSNFKLELKIDANDDYLYQWQWMDGEGYWHNVGGGNASVYDMAERSLEKGTYTFRCVVTSEYGLQMAPAQQITVIVK